MVKVKVRINSVVTGDVFSEDVFEFNTLQEAEEYAEKAKMSNVTIEIIEE